MNSTDLLNLFLVLAVLTITGCMVFLTFFFIQALKSIQNLSDHLIDVTEGLKNKAGIKMLSAIPSVLIALIGRIIKRRG